MASTSLHHRGLQHARLPCPPLSPKVCTSSSVLSWWVHPTISASVDFSPFAFSLSQRQGLFQWVSSSHQVTQSIGASASVLPVNSQAWFPLRLTGLISLQSKGLSKESSPEPQFESVNFLALSFVYGPTCTSVHDYWKNLSFDYMFLCQQSNISAL